MIDTPSPSSESPGSSSPKLQDKSLTREKSRRQLENALWTVASPTMAILVALLIAAIILWVSGFDPLKAYEIMWLGAFKDIPTISEVLLKAVPLIFTGVGLALAFRCGVVNLGAEGQFYAGAVSAVLAGIYLGFLPAFVLVPIVLLSGVISGALWGMLAGWLKVRFGASEVVTTIMLNYVAIIATGYLVTGPMKEAAVGFPQTARIAEAARLWRFLPPTRLHIGFFLAIIVAVIVWLLVFRTSTGFAIRAVGQNPEAARFAGINVNRNMLLALAISGGAAGLGGAVELTGLTYRLFQLISPGYGFDAIAVSLLVNNNPLGVIFSGILFGALRSGSEAMQISFKVPSVLVSAIQGLVILSVVTFSVYRTKLMRRRED